MEKRMNECIYHKNFRFKIANFKNLNYGYRHKIQMQTKYCSEILTDDCKKKQDTKREHLFFLLSF